MLSYLHLDGTDFCRIKSKDDSKASSRLMGERASEVLIWFGVNCFYYVAISGDHGSLALLLPKAISRAIGQLPSQAALQHLLSPFYCCGSSASSASVITVPPHSKRAFSASRVRCSSLIFRGLRTDTSRLGISNVASGRFPRLVHSRALAASGRLTLMPSRLRRRVRPR